MSLDLAPWPIKLNYGQSDGQGMLSSFFLKSLSMCGGCSNNLIYENGERLAIKLNFIGPNDHRPIQPLARITFTDVVEAFCGSGRTTYTQLTQKAINVYRLSSQTWIRPGRL